MNQSSTTTTAASRDWGVRSLVVMGFGVFLSVMPPVMMSAMAGERIDTLQWLAPLALPSAIAFFVMTKAPDAEAERQAADISRWEV